MEESAWNKQNDSELTQVQNEIQNLLDGQAEIRSEIEQLKASRSDVPSEILLRTSALSERRGKQAEIENELQMRRGDFLDAAGKTIKFTHQQSPNTSAPAADSKQQENPKRIKPSWDQHNLRRLLDESREPGATQAKLAKQYGVSRQRIGKLLKQAGAQFSSSKKADPFSSLLHSKRK